MFSRFIKRKRVNQRVSEIRNRLFRTAYAWCHDAVLAQDLAQEAALRAIEKSAQLKDLQALDAWIFTILSNCHRQHLRDSARSSALDDELEPAIAANLLPDRITETGSLVAQVKTALECLGDDQRKVITLVDIEDFSYAEVAAILEIPVGTVMSRLCRARRQLKRRLLADPLSSSATVTYLERKG